MIVGANNGVMRSNGDIFYKTCEECKGACELYSVPPPWAGDAWYNLYEYMECPFCKGLGYEEDPLPECTCEEDEGNCPFYAWLDRQWKLQEIYESND